MEDRWIFSRLNATAETANRAIEQYRYHEYAQLVWHFFWHEFCDWYLELKKVSGAGWDNAVRAFETALRLLHPAMPFLTEELWQRLDRPADGPKSIALAPYPQFRPELADRRSRTGDRRPAGGRDHGAHAAHRIQTRSQAAVRRRLVLPHRLARNRQAPRRSHPEDRPRHISNSNPRPRPKPLPRSAPPPNSTWSSTFPRLQDDPARRQKEIEQFQKNIANSERQLNDPVFMSKAPAKVIETIRAKLADYKAQLEKLL